MDPPVSSSVLVLALLALSFLLVFGQGTASSCTPVIPVEYSYSISQASVNVPQIGCSKYSGSYRTYVRCTSGASPLKDNDLGPDCDITGQTQKLHMWEHSGGDSNTIHTLVFKFRQSVSPTLIRLHYFSDPSIGAGVPSLTVYSNFENPWDDPGIDPRITGASSQLNDESELPHRETLDINVYTVTQLTSLYIRITLRVGNRVSSFYLSEMEVFTCDPGLPDACVTHTCCTEINKTCVINSTAPDGYECVYPPTDVPTTIATPCSSDPCQNGGTCLDHQGSYNCMCQTDFTGENCESKLTTTTHATSPTAKPGGEMSSADGEMSPTTDQVNPSTLSNTTFTIPPTTSDSADSDENDSLLIMAVGGALAGVAAVLIILILLVLAVVYYRRKKGKQRSKKIQHVGEDESNVYALVNMAKKKKKNAAPEVPEQNFNPTEEGLNNRDDARHMHDPSTGQTSIDPPDHISPYASTAEATCNLPPTPAPAAAGTNKTEGHMYDTIPDANEAGTDSYPGGGATGTGFKQLPSDHDVSQMYAVVHKKGKTTETPSNPGELQ